MVPGSLCVSGYIHLSAIDITPPAKYKHHSAGCPSTLSSVSKVYRKVSRVAPPRRAAAHEGPKLDRHFRSTGDQYSAQVRPRGPRRTELRINSARGRCLHSLSTFLLTAGATTPNGKSLPYAPKSFTMSDPTQSSPANPSAAPTHLEPSELGTKE